jgi:hypothetical protein
MDLDSGELTRVAPECGMMSQGIGMEWLKKYWPEVYLARDGVVLPGGKKIPAPRTYDRWLQKMKPELKEEKELERYKEAGRWSEDRTPRRMLDREICALARENQRRRRL